MAESSTGSISASSGLTVSCPTYTAAIFDLGANHSDSVAGTVILDGGGSITGTGTSALAGTSYDVRNGSVSAILAGSGIALTKSTSGHVSARIGADRFLIPRRDASRAGITADDIVVCDLDAKVLAGNGPCPAETHIHAGVYRARPDVAAIVHRAIAEGSHKDRGREMPGLLRAGHV